MKLQGKVALITGGASGIGRALAEELALRGCEVVLADRQIELAREVEQKIVDGGAKASSYELDVRRLENWDRVMRDVITRSRRVDFFFNNAGIGVGGEMCIYDPEDYDDVFDVNLRGVAYGIQSVYPIMIAQRSGHIINTASVAGLIAAPGNGSYTATKHAVVALSKALRVEAKRHGVNVSALCPGAIRTPILSGGRFGRLKLDGANEANVMKHWEKARPMDPRVFAKKVVDAVLSNTAIIVVPKWWKILWYIDRINPLLSMAILSQLHERLRREMEADGISFERPQKKPAARTQRGDVQLS